MQLRRISEYLIMAFQITPYGNGSPVTLWMMERLTSHHPSSQRHSCLANFQIPEDINWSDMLNCITVTAIKFTVVLFEEVNPYFQLSFIATFVDLLKALW